jgi:DNA-binding LacI/PurR family transcriptional regulator
LCAERFVEVRRQRRTGHNVLMTPESPTPSAGNSSATRGGPRRRPTLGDVARVAGVDLSTVSRLLRNHTENHRPETRDRVLAAAAELGYRTNPQARALRMGRQHAIAMLAPDLVNFGFTQVLRGAQQACDERDFTMLISEVPARPGQPAGRPDGLDGRVDGVLVAFATADDSRIGEWLDALGLPAVMVQRGTPDADASVLFDEEANAAAMVDFLVGLGHRHIAHVSGSLRTDTAIRRQRGFDEAAARHGLVVREEWRADGEWSIEGGRAAALQILSAPVPRPTALAVDSLVEAIGTLSALHELGVDVPGEVSVITIDEHLVAAHTTPSLTTVRLDQRELGRRAASMLLDRIDGKPGSHVIVPSPAEIIARASTAPPPHRPA